MEPYLTRKYRWYWFFKQSPKRNFSCRCTYFIQGPLVLPGTDHTGFSCVNAYSPSIFEELAERVDKLHLGDGGAGCLEKTGICHDDGQALGS